MKDPEEVLECARKFLVIIPLDEQPPEDAKVWVSVETVGKGFSIGFNTDYGGAGTPPLNQSQAITILKGINIREYFIAPRHTVNFKADKK